MLLDALSSFDDENGVDANNDVPSSDGSAYVCACMDDVVGACAGVDDGSVTPVAPSVDEPGDELTCDDVGSTESLVDLSDGDDVSALDDGVLDDAADGAVGVRLARDAASELASSSGPVRVLDDAVVLLDADMTIDVCMYYY